MRTQRLKSEGMGLQMPSQEQVDLRRFQFRGLHPNIFIGRATAGALTLSEVKANVREDEVQAFDDEKVFRTDRYGRTK